MPRVVFSFWQGEESERVVGRQRVTSGSRGHAVPLGCVKTTPQMTCFRDAKVCNNWLQIRIDDHRKSQLDHKIQKERNKYLVLRLRGETDHYTNGNVTTKTLNSTQRT